MAHTITLDGNDFQITDGTKLEDLILAIRVREYRAEAEWTQEALAAETDVSTKTIQRIEGGRGTSVDNVKALAVAFELAIGRTVTPDDLRRAPASWSAAKEAFDKTHQWVQVTPRPTGRALVDTLDGTNALVFEVLEVEIDQLEDPARTAVDSLHASISEWKEVWWDLDVRGRQEAAAHLNGQITALHGLGLKLFGGQQRIADGQLPLVIAHVFACPLDSALQFVAAPRKPILTF